MPQLKQQLPDEYRRHLVPINQALISPPNWVVPGLLVPGLNLVAGPPKTFKSRLILSMCAAIVHGIPVGDPKKERLAKTPGPCVYFAAEQGAGRLRHIYESHILKRKLPEGKALWDLSFARDPLRWQIDTPAPGYNLLDFIEAWKPALLCIDPWIYFHSFEENDPGMVKPLLDYIDLCRRIGTAFVIVHHSRKSQGSSSGMNSRDTGPVFDRVRGTGALFGACDGAIMTHKLTTGVVNIITEFKEHPGSAWTWRP